MMLHVQYLNNRYDFVNTRTLDRLIAAKGIRRFRRPSKKRWIDADRGPLRGSGGTYSGRERRQSFYTFKLPEHA